MAYRNFKIEDIRTRLGITDRIELLFEKIEAIQPSARILEQLEEVKKMPLLSEKAKSEAIVWPILMEMRRRNNEFFTIYSGANLEVDKSLGLVGECDFILARDLRTITMNSPIFSLVEAKKGEIELGIGQCSAQMFAAQMLNKSRNFGLEAIYGCVTNASEWQFLQLSGDQLLLDSESYFTNDLPKLLGVFQHIIDYYKATI